MEAGPRSTACAPLPHELHRLTLGPLGTAVAFVLALDVQKADIFDALLEASSHSTASPSKLLKIFDPLISESTEAILLNSKKYTCAWLLSGFVDQLTQGWCCCR